jgi:phytoene dehydrogenase-like protein
MSSGGGLGGGDSYDGIVIGGGHNGLILQGYLLRAGLKVLVVERMVELGGGLDAHEDPRAPGFWHNVHSVFHRGAATLPWFRDLNMRDFDVAYVAPDPGVSMMLPERQSLVWYADVNRTCASIARHSRRDAETFREIHGRYQSVVRDVVFPETYAPPMPFEAKRELLERSAAGREYLRYTRCSPEQFILEHFENDQVRAFIAFLAVMRGFEIDAEGLGFLVPGMIAWGVNPQLCKGTSHALADRLVDMVAANGGDVIEANGVERIVVEDGVARGVVLQDGTVIRASKFIASSVNPQETLLRLVGAQHLEADLAGRVDGFAYSPTTPIFAVNLSLREPPRYLSAELEPDIHHTCMYIVGLDGYQDIRDLYADCRAGNVPRKSFMNGACLTVHDPSQAPPGGHCAFTWQLAPYDLADGGPERWDALREEFGQRQLARWREYAPNLDERNIISMHCNTPLDIERHDPNMRRGDWMVGELNANQALDKRPLPELSQYRTPIANLYLCGSSCHPGGNITGAPGYNAAGVIARDLGLDPWWSPHDVAELWARLGD